MKSTVRGCCRVPFACAVLAGCFASSPPLPPVRWFDPMPASPVDAGAGRFELRVEAPVVSGREFLVRVGPHELAVDAQHQWFAEPRLIVAAVLSRALAGAPIPQTRATAELLAFELDATAAPRAHVRVAFVGPRPDGLPAELEVWADAADRSPPAFAAAMAEALVALAARVHVR